VTVPNLTEPQKRLLVLVRRQQPIWVTGARAQVARSLEGKGLVRIEHDQFGNKRVTLAND